MKLQRADFYKLYIPALEQALKNDSVNTGFYVKPPEDYLDIELAKQVAEYLEEKEDAFTEKVAYYFDAKSHYFPSIQNIHIDDYKEDLIKGMFKIKNEFLIK